MQKHAPGKRVFQIGDRVHFWVNGDPWSTPEQTCSELADMGWKRWVKRHIKPRIEEGKRARKALKRQKKQWDDAEDRAVRWSIAESLDEQVNATFALADATAGVGEYAGTR
jgi:hypothetical protein